MVRLEIVVAWSRLYRLDRRKSECDNLGQKERKSGNVKPLSIWYNSITRTSSGVAVLTQTRSLNVIGQFNYVVHHAECIKTNDIPAINTIFMKYSG